MPPGRHWRILLCESHFALFPVREMMLYSGYFAADWTLGCRLFHFALFVSACRYTDARRKGRRHAKGGFEEMEDLV